MTEFERAVAKVEQLGGFVEVSRDEVGQTGSQSN